MVKVVVCRRAIIIIDKNNTRGADKSLARRTSRYHWTESRVSLERGVYLCAKFVIRFLLQSLK
jgi:hypothetical protein